MKEILCGLGEITGGIALEMTVRALLKRSYAVLRYTVQNLSGATTSLLLRTGLRVTVARMTGAMVGQLTTRAMLALASTASGIGIVIGILELISLVLEMMLMFDWDPGNYNSQFDNDVYDDMIRGWIRVRQTYAMDKMSPRFFLSMFDSAMNDRSSRVEGDRIDDSSRTVAQFRTRFYIGDEKNAPWYFAKFPLAVRALVQDERLPSTTKKTSNKSRTTFDPSSRKELLIDRRIALTTNDDGERDPLVRLLPLHADQPLVMGMLWSMQYMRHRAFNSEGQRFDHEDPNDRTNVDDAWAEERMRDIAGLSENDDVVSRQNIASICTRSIADKIATILQIGTMTAIFVCANCILFFFASPFVTLASNILLALIVALTIALIMFYTMDNIDATYDRLSARQRRHYSSEDVYSRTIVNLVAVIRRAYKDRYRSDDSTKTAHASNILIWALKCLAPYEFLVAEDHSEENGEDAEG